MKTECKGSSGAPKNKAIAIFWHTLYHSRQHCRDARMNWRWGLVTTTRRCLRRIGWRYLHAKRPDGRIASTLGFIASIRTTTPVNHRRRALHFGRRAHRWQRNL